MTASRIYVLPLPLVGQRPPSSKTEKNVSTSGVLGTGSGSVEPISTKPGTQKLRGYYRGRLAWKLAAELNQLSELDGTVPIYGTRDEDAAGYFAIDSVEASAVEAPAAAWLQQYSLTITRKDTRSSAFRAVQTSRPLAQADHPFGNDVTGELAIPAAATDVQWLDEETGQTADPSLVATRSAERGDVDVYDAWNAPYQGPTLIYSLPYREEGEVDPRVWDERGVGSKYDESGTLAWQKCFSPAHDYAGERVLDNGLYRLRFAPDGAGLSAERWDDSAGAWADQSLGASDWALSKVDMRRIGLERVDARVTFEDTTSTETYPLALSVKRGWVDPLWAEIDGEGGTPPGLVDLLDPIASPQLYDPVAEQGLIDRSEVGK